jgi:ABC-type branched-subunit amino acid transport system substrate-binding protein/serine/threonine protein kinase
MAETQPLLPGDPERLGDYELTGRLGEGGQGIVFLGRSPSGDPVAVKLLLAQLTGDEAARNRFVRELEVTKHVAGFCTAEVLDADVAGDRPYIVSEYVEGPSLRELVRDEGPRRGSALMRLAIGTATALAAIHQQGIVHRDFKPPNVLMGPDGPRVIDFGVARALDANAVTMTSQVVGTPAYMAPEQVAGGAVGAPADMFAWGATMGYAATGDSPFGNDSIPAVMHRIMHVDPDLSVLPEPLRGLVARCLAKNPAQRPTAHAALLQLVGGVAAPAPAPGGGIGPALAQGAQLAVSDLPSGPSGGWRHNTPQPPPPRPPSTTGPQGRSGPNTGPNTGPRGGPPTRPPAPPPTTSPSPGSPGATPGGDGGGDRGGDRGRRRLILALAAPVAVLLVAGAVFGIRMLGGSDNPVVATPTSVKIGFLGALTGNSANFAGTPTLNAAKLAVKEYNATNPQVKVELVTADTQGRADQAPQAAQRLVQQGVVGVIGPQFTPESLAAGPVLEQAGIPNISTTSSGRALSGNNWKFWHRLAASDQEVATLSAEFIARAVKPGKAFVVDDQDTYTRDLAADFSKTLEGKKVDVEKGRIDSLATDHSAVVDKIDAANPDVIFYGGTFRAAARLIKQVRDAGVDSQFVLGDAALVADFVAAAGRGDAEGTVFGCACYDASQDPAKGAETFRNHYRSEYGRTPGYFTVEGYDAALALLAPLKEGKATRDQINQRLATVTVTGASRTVRFGGTGDQADARVYVYQVKSGRIELIGDTKTANL